MTDFRYETGTGHSSHQGCVEYVPEIDEDYVTSEGEVRRKTTWDCPVHGEVVVDESYLIVDEDDEKFIWGCIPRS